MPESSGLLTSKIGPQGRGKRNVARARLVALLESAPEARLVLVSAPAGFGKSTLLAEWVGATAARCSWISLDAGDNDIVRFTGYLAAAAGLRSPKAQTTPFETSAAFDPDLALSGILDRIAEGVQESSTGGAVIVLDDYHLIDDAAVHRLVGSIIERLPPRTRLAIATRADPPLPLARLRARGELLEVRAENLRFTAPEAYELLRSGGVELGPSEIEELVGRTEGWAAALRLAAVSLQGRPNQAELVRRFGASHRFVLDYVVEEVLAGLPPETQDFLLRTSILERLNASLCEAVTEERNGQFRLEALERANLLIVPLDNERYWYRYHALFAQILQARLGILHSDEINQLHARASVWYEKSGDDDEAIAHALKSGDPQRAGRIVSDASFRHMNAGELSTVRRWLAALPPEVVRSHAQLSAWYAWSLVLAGETNGVAERLADAERAAAGGGDDSSTPSIAISTQVAMVRSQLAGLEGDTAAAIAQARLALELKLVHGGPSTDAEASLRGTPAIFLGLALGRAGDLNGAAQAYEEALPDLRAANNMLAVGRGIADLAAIAIALGDPERALRLCESELSRPESESTVTGSGAVWAALARARAELGQIELADAAARHSVELAGLAGDAPALRSAQATLARIAPLLAAGAASSRSSLQRTVAAPVETLTAREIEVLRLVALGRSNSQIAAELFVTVGTIKSHLHTIAGKLGASNRVEAVARGRELGLLA